MRETVTGNKRHGAQRQRGVARGLVRGLSAGMTGGIVGTALVLMLAACVSEPKAPPFYDDMARVNAVVDSQSAAAMISNYRANNGLGLIMADPALMQLAQAQARAMANAGSVNASLEPGNRLPDLLAGIGQGNTDATNNVSGGYRTLAEAFSGWRESPKHNAVMLDARATRFGIATAYSANAKHKVFWSLIMAAPQGSQSAAPVSSTTTSYSLVPTPKAH